MFELHCQSQHPALLRLSIRTKKPAGFLRTLGVLAQVPLGWLGTSRGSVHPVPAPGFTLAAGPHSTLLRGLESSGLQVIVRALVCLHPSHWPPATTYSSKVQLSHLCENSSDTWRTDQFPSSPQTHRTSLSGGMPGTSMSTPSQESLRQAGVCSIKVLELGPRAAMQQGLCRQAQHVGSPSDSRGACPFHPHPTPSLPAHSHTTPEAETT